MNIKIKSIDDIFVIFLQLFLFTYESYSRIRSKKIVVGDIAFMLVISLNYSLIIYRFQKVHFHLNVTQAQTMSSCQKQAVNS